MNRRKIAPELKRWRHTSTTRLLALAKHLELLPVSLSARDAAAAPLSARRRACPVVRQRKRWHVILSVTLPSLPYAELRITVRASKPLLRRRPSEDQR